MGLLDALSGGPRSVGELATTTQTDTRALYRLLRCAAAMGYAREIESDRDGLAHRRFGITARGELLRTDQPGSLHALALLVHSDWQSLAWRNLTLGIQSGTAVLPQVLGETAYSYLEARPEDFQVFNRAMTSVSSMMEGQLAMAYDFTDATTVVDVGGGRGSFLAAIMDRNPTLYGILIDLPQVAEAAIPFIAARGLIDRCQVVAADFFHELPPMDDGSIVILKRVLHNWGDADARRILRTVRAAMRTGDRLLIAQPVLPEYDCDENSALLDLGMLLLYGGIERTLREHRRLAENCDFSFVRHIQVSPVASLVEVVAC
jgi:hypothetical protein